MGRASSTSPTEGGALLVANHAAAIPSDAPVIMHGIETELDRPCYGLADHLFRTMPVVGTYWARLGGVVAHPDNAYRLLREQQQLVLVFPEGAKGPGKSYRERYQLRRFGRGGFVEIAMRAGVPIVPIAVVGAEESMPILWKSHRLAKALRLPYFPVTANQLVLGPGARHGRLLPGQVQASRARTHPLRRAARRGALLEEPHHGRVRAHPRADPGRALRHAAYPPVGLVRLTPRAAEARGANPSGRSGADQPVNCGDAVTAAAAAVVVVDGGVTVMLITPAGSQFDVPSFAV